MSCRPCSGVGGSGSWFIQPITGQPASMQSDRTARRSSISTVRWVRVNLRENYGFKGRALAAVERLINGHVNELCRAWEEIHGIAE